jgi:DNA-binding response OmpR family regulator
MKTPGPCRILLVDDEKALRDTMGPILRLQGYEVVTAASVREALQEITSARFDVLVADLNIGSPGDGFTVVSAMRRSYPDCVTLILTGFPAFETALKAIRNQVDDYLVKPASPQSLVAAIESRLRDRQPHSILVSKRVSELLRENAGEIARRTLDRVMTQPELAKIPLTKAERIDHIPPLLEDIADMLERPEDEVPRALLRSGALHGQRRFQQGYTIPLMILGMRLLQDVIYDVAREHLLELNLSYLLQDLKNVNGSLAAQLREAVTNFLSCENQAA